MDLKKQINDIIEADIQIALNDYIEKEGSQGEKGDKLNARVSQKEVDKIIKEFGTPVYCYSYNQLKKNIVIFFNFCIAKRCF